MPLPHPTQVQHIAIIGTGVIGSGWVAHFLRNGMDVTFFFPYPKSYRYNPIISENANLNDTQA